MHVSHIPEGYHAVTPYLAPRDADACLAFLKATFEATIIDETRRHADARHAADRRAPYRSWGTARSTPVLGAARHTWTGYLGSSCSELSGRMPAGTRRRRAGCGGRRDLHPPPGSGSGTGSRLLHYFSTTRVDSRELRWTPVDSAAADKRLTSNVLDHKLRVVRPVAEG